MLLLVEGQLRCSASSYRRLPGTFRPATFAPQVTESSASCVYTASMLSKHHRFLIVATTPKSPGRRRRKSVYTTFLSYITTRSADKRVVDIYPGLQKLVRRTYENLCRHNDLANIHVQPYRSDGAATEGCAIHAYSIELRKQGDTPHKNPAQFRLVESNSDHYTERRL